MALAVRPRLENVMRYFRPSGKSAAVDLDTFRNILNRPAQTYDDPEQRERVSRKIVLWVKRPAEPKFQGMMR